MFGKKSQTVVDQQYQRLEQDHWRLKEEVTALTVASNRQVAPRYDRQIAAFTPKDDALGFLDRVIQHSAPGSSATYIGTLVIVQQGATYIGGNQTTSSASKASPDHYTEIKSSVALAGFKRVQQIAVLSLDDPVWRDLENHFDADRLCLQRAAQELLQ
jgi:hypothetical protein